MHTPCHSPPAAPAPVKLYRVAEVSKMLGVCRATVYNLVRDGKLTLVKIGKRSSGITSDSLAALVSRPNNTN
ncbi:helix-turn-helix domain-containing protein [Burkholderia cenocepacia]|uniref:helix-turn-helix transcriptional regulator n=1 Tax=Burkholderia cenocepacia TaxID=95486 RepID=UPI00222FD85E|nr:helix-turn-helix domain-containing protein [Burkholderia cenocepacia]MCW3521205.1 helix-turn-helix domain-containing protein [Burkholderia cenocepacia]MCW3612402.1 helix-turn-helix domain-containing protein [Burkholderia cenocepacia]MCW3650240.1 helix-turn-helix domain-containing protein [Burkholderia cenocepacia]MCW3657891.1 helix-turn-helix domain-containing protein [Burkholderia cenocepacia]MCW3664223.1 helix-turn-helix domain-containing protein [Burkholderia cenocepacia]